MAQPSILISYVSQYREWAEALLYNLEECFRREGRGVEVFLDNASIQSGTSWVVRLNDALSRAQHLVLLATPEALASPRVIDEWSTFISAHEDWRNGFLHILQLIDTPLPAFLNNAQHIDFTAHSPERYRSQLSKLVAAVLNSRRRNGQQVSIEGLRIPEPPMPAIPSKLRSQLVAALSEVLKDEAGRTIISATTFEGDPKGLDFYGGLQCAASALLLPGRRDRNRNTIVAAVEAVDRVLDVLPGNLLSDRQREELEASRIELVRVNNSRRPARTPIRVWLDWVAEYTGTAVQYFRERAQLNLLSQVYVSLELQHYDLDSGETPAGQDLMWREATDLDLRALLELDVAEHEWITRRWVVRGDPGAGKTTMLRQLARRLAGERDPSWLPVYAALPELMADETWILDRIERELVRAGEPAAGLARALDTAGNDGRILMLLDGLDELSRRQLPVAQRWIQTVSRRWPQSTIVVASRPIGYQRPTEDFVELELLPFDRERRHEFLSLWLGRKRGEPDRDAAAIALDRLEADPMLWEISGNPLYLTLLALLLEQPLQDGEQPRTPGRLMNRSQVYDEIFELLLAGRHRWDEPHPMPSADAVRAALRCIAEGMTRDNLDTEALDALEIRLSTRGDVRSRLEFVARWRERGMQAFLAELAVYTGILGPHDGPNRDWRFWHRTFKEALTAETLEETFRNSGEKTLLERARELEGEEGQWGEPYALLVGRIDSPDALLRSLFEVNRELGVRALAGAQSLTSSTLYDLVGLTDHSGQREVIFEHLPRLLGDPQRALDLVDQLRRETRTGRDLYTLDRVVQAIASQWQGCTDEAAYLRAHLYDHIPDPPRDLFEQIELTTGRESLWRPIPAGSFRLGSPEDESGRDESEGPQHSVVVKSSFLIGAVAVTNAMYLAFDNTHKIRVIDGVSDEELLHHPVVDVTWHDAVAFCRWLGSHPGFPDARLPTEMEWEYACRAGTETPYNDGNGAADPEFVGWYERNSDGRTHKVGEKPRNAWGLYDTHGNVLEWTLSEWIDDYAGHEGGTEICAPDVAVPDIPTGMVSCRGGGFQDWAGAARSGARASRNVQYGDRDLGFRVVLLRRESDTEVSDES